MKLSSGDLIIINSSKIESWETNSLPNYEQDEIESWVTVIDRYLEVAGQILKVIDTTYMYNNHCFVHAKDFTWWIPTEIIDVVFEN